MSRYALPADGPPIASEADVLDIIASLYGSGADTVVIPLSRLSPEFFRLSSGLAGAVLQKFTNYQLRVVIVGDVSAMTARSEPLRDFVRESNRTGQVLFVGSETEL